MIRCFTILLHSTRKTGLSWRLTFVLLLIYEDIYFQQYIQAFLEP